MGKAIDKRLTELEKRAPRPKQEADPEAVYTWIDDLIERFVAEGRLSETGEILISFEQPSREHSLLCMCSSLVEMVLRHA